MDYGLSGRRAYLMHRDDPIGVACARALIAEGATIADACDDSVDVVVAKAGAATPSSLLDVGSADELHASWDAVVDAVDAYRSALPGMIEREWGRFVWVGTSASRSLDAGDDIDELGAIVTLAMRAANKVAASEVGKANITANSVLYGGDAMPDDVAATVAYMCSVGTGYMTGISVAVDGGVGSAMY
jgi:NAD(P)-dependent dehydrogenase (short-subunit alcohol dehydrogenase family)